MTPIARNPAEGSHGRRGTPEAVAPMKRRLVGKDQEFYSVFGDILAPIDEVWDATR